MTKHADIPQLIRGGTLIAITLLLQACSGMSKIDVQKLVTHGRDGWQLPDQIVKTLQPMPGDVVADTRLQTDLKPESRVIHVDHRDNMSGILRVFQTTDHWTNLETMRTEMDKVTARENCDSLTELQ